MSGIGPRRKGSSGFTLIEIMVVVVIIGLILGVAASTWASMVPNQEFNTTIRNLSEVLYGTRSDAIARNREFQIRYDITNDTYRVKTPFQPGGGFARTEADEDHLFVHETDLAAKHIDIVQVTVDDVPYVDGEVKVTFSPLGASSHHTIQLRQTHFDPPREFTLEVLPLTGEIRMHDGLFEREPAEENDFK